MKFFFCPSCHDKKTAEDNVIIKVCPSCQESMKEMDKDEVRGELFLNSILNNGVKGGSNGLP